MLIARIFPRPCGARKNTTQLAKYPRVLYVKPSNKMYLFYKGAMDMKWDITNEARSADFISCKPEKNNCFIKNTTTHEWESEQKK